MGNIKWWKKNRKCERIWIEQNQNIHHDSLAYQCANNEEFSEEGEGFSPDVWFLEGNFQNISEVFEQSINLGYDSTVMTLLGLS